MKGNPHRPQADSGTRTPALSTLAQWVVFRLDECRYALPLNDVVRIVRAAEVTPLPKAPPIVLGVIDIEGDVLPVCNLRRRLQLKDRPVTADDHFLLAFTARRTVVLVIDEALGVVEHPAVATIPAASIAPGLEHVRGVLALEDGLVLIHDLEKFLSLEEVRTLDEALHAH